MTVGLLFRKNTPKRLTIVSPRTYSSPTRSRLEARYETYWRPYHRNLESTRYRKPHTPVRGLKYKRTSIRSNTRYSYKAEKAALAKRKRRNKKPKFYKKAFRSSKHKHRKVFKARR